MRISSGRWALWGLRPRKSFITPFLPAWILGTSGVLLVPRSGSGESPPSVNTDENWLLRTSAFPLASTTVLLSFFSDATPELSHFCDKSVSLLVRLDFL